MAIPGKKIRESSPEKEPVIPLFPLLEEKKDMEEKKEEAETSCQGEEKFQELVIVTTKYEKLLTKE